MYTVPTASRGYCAGESCVSEGGEKEEIVVAGNPANAFVLKIEVTSRRESHMPSCRDFAKDALVLAVAALSQALIIPAE